MIVFHEVHTCMFLRYGEEWKENPKPSAKKSRLSDYPNLNTETFVNGSGNTLSYICSLYRDR